MWKNTKILVFFAVIAILLASAGKMIHSYWKLREPLRAKKTEARMIWLMGVLDTEQPRRLDRGSLHPILAKYNRLDCEEDAWGRPFLIERQMQADGTMKYRVISLGRDGKRGPCCQKWVTDWNADAVLFGTDWLQVWDPKGAQTQAVNPPLRRRQ